MSPDVAIRNPYARSRQGCPAGIASRGVSAAIDLGLLALLTFVGLALFGFVRSLITSHPMTVPNPGPIVASFLAFGVAVVYYVSSWTTTGRTVGDAAIGVRVVGAAGHSIGFRRAVIRAVVVFFFGPVLSLWCIVSRRNNALYDLALRTTVLYDWTIA